MEIKSKLYNYIYKKSEAVALLLIYHNSIRYEMILNSALFAIAW